MICLYTGAILNVRRCKEISASMSMHTVGMWLFNKHIPIEAGVHCCSIDKVTSA